MDIEDVAAAHTLAMLTPKAQGRCAFMHTAHCATTLRNHIKPCVPECVHVKVRAAWQTAPQSTGTACRWLSEHEAWRIRLASP